MRVSLKKIIEEGLGKFRAVVLIRGSVEPQGFDEVVSSVRWTLSDILTYYK